MIEKHKKNPYLFGIFVILIETLFNFIGSLIISDFNVPLLIPVIMAAVISARYIHTEAVTSSYVTKFIYTYTGIPTALAIFVLWAENGLTGSLLFSVVAIFAIVSALGYLIFMKFQPYMLKKLAENNASKSQVHIAE
jgi:hypothetical protein